MTQIKDILNEALASKVFAGYGFGLSARGRQHLFSGGRLWFGVSYPSVNYFTRFDIASITKVFAHLTFLKMTEMSEFGVSLDSPVSAVLPLRHVRGLTFRHLLSCGASFTLPPFLQGDQLGLRNEAGEFRLFEEIRCEGTPGEVFRYSNILAFLLGEAIERIAGMELSEAIKKITLVPLDLADEWMCAWQPGSERDNIAHTDCVHAGEENEFSLNKGISQDPMTKALYPKRVAISGMFGTTAFVLGLAKYFATGLTSAAEEFLSHRLFCEMMRNQHEGRTYPNGKHRYGLGLDMFDYSYLPDHPSFCREAGVMTGATGTMFCSWKNEKGNPFALALLSNAPSNDLKDHKGRKRIFHVRRALISAALEALM